MWYEWRMKLLEGLKEGLERHVDEMKSDSTSLSKQEQPLDRVVPNLVDKHASLESEAHILQQQAEEMENCDQEELRSTRDKLSAVDAEIATKKKLLAEMQADLQQKSDTIEAGAELKAEFLDEIREAERIREECRGWSVKEVNALKSELSHSDFAFDNAIKGDLITNSEYSLCSSSRIPNRLVHRLRSRLSRLPVWTCSDNELPEPAPTPFSPEGF
jgi:kinetochore protein Spc7/SPC105